MGSKLMEPVDIEAYASIYHPRWNKSSICLSIAKIQSNGIFHPSNPLDYSVPLLLAQLSLASIFILLSTRILKPLGQPTTVIQIFAGLALGPSFLGRFAGFAGFAETLYPFRSLVLLDSLAVIGFIFYFFMIGIHIDPCILKRIEKKEVYIGISTVVLALVLSIFSSIIIPKSTIFVEADIASSLPVVAVSSSVLALPIIAHYLTELKMVNSEFGRMALSSSAVSNLIGFFVIFITTAANETSSEKTRMLETAYAGGCFAAVMIFAVRPIMNWKLKRTIEGEPLGQAFVYMVFLGVLLTGFVSKALGLHIYFGPLVLGLIIPAGPPLGSALVEKLDLFVSGLFMPLYFVKIGLVTDIFAVRAKTYLVVQSVILIACTGKFLGALFSSIYNNVPLCDAILIGLVVNFQGALELGMFKMMEHSKAINHEVFVVQCTSLLIVAALVTPILKYMYDPMRRYAVYTRRTVQDLKSGSELRTLVCIHDQDNVPNTINLFEIMRDPFYICVLHLVELVGIAHPIIISHDETTSISKRCFSSRNIVKAFSNFQESHEGVVNLDLCTAFSTYGTMHDHVCAVALEKKTCIIILPYRKRYDSTKVIAPLKPEVKIMSKNILQMAPCSVAILVEREPATSSSTALETWTTYPIAVLFLGGPDDREALALGARMVGQTNTNMTILRIIENGHSNTNQPLSKQRELDNKALCEMRSRLAGYHQVVYIEELVSDGKGTYAVIQSLQNQYKLIITGRSHNSESQLMLGLPDMKEQSELGVIADLIASPDSKSCANILVVQQHRYLLGQWKENRSAKHNGNVPPKLLEVASLSFQSRA